MAKSSGFGSTQPPSSLAQGGKARGKKRPFSPAAKVAAGLPASQRSGGRYTKYSGLPSGVTQG
eukprot:4696351-Amphidinium_carterae.1